MDTLRFRDLEDGQGTAGGLSALGEWYNSFLDKPIGLFSIDDLCRCCRQELHLPHVIPVVVAALKETPLAGYQYDGELVSAVCRINRATWAEISETVPVISAIIRQAFDQFDEDIQAELHEFLREFPCD